MRKSTVAILALACGLALSPTAAAQERPDPDSPAGVEYELPLDRTREDLSEGPGGDGGEPDVPDGADGSDDGVAPLFGAGITPDSGGDDAVGTDAADGDLPASDSSVGGGEPDGGQDDGDTRAGDARADSNTGQGFTSYGPSGGTDSNGLLIPGIALGVLLAGGALGLALRQGLGGASRS